MLVVASLPTPRDVGWNGDSIMEFLSEHGTDYLVTLLGLILLISYWIESNDRGLRASW